MSEQIIPIQIEVLLQHYGWASLASETEPGSIEMSSSDELPLEINEEHPVVTELFGPTAPFRKRHSS